MNKKYIVNYLSQYIELIHDFWKCNFGAVQLRCLFDCGTHCCNFGAVQLRCLFDCGTHCFSKFLIFFHSNVIHCQFNAILVSSSVDEAYFSDLLFWLFEWTTFFICLCYAYLFLVRLPYLAKYFLQYCFPFAYKFFSINNF